MSEQFYSEIGECRPDSLIVSTKVSLITRGIVVASGQGTLKRGSLMGKNEDNKSYLVGSIDNLLTSDGILTDDVDTTKGAITTTEYITGCFNKECIIVSDGHIINEYEKDLRNLGIYLETISN